MKWEGVTPEMYEKVRKIVNWEGNSPSGAVFHVAGFTDAGLHVTDIWESPEQMNDFVQNRLMPAVAQIEGFDKAPQVEVFPMHAIFVAQPAKLN